MKLDSSLAWKQASTAISANRDVLLALAGVFFLLPRLAFSLLVPEPPARSGMEAEEMVTVMQGYYLQVTPFLLPMMLLQAVGMLSILALFTDRTRPTVREAIGHGIRALLPYIGAQLVFGLSFSLGGGALLAVLSLGGMKSAASLVMAALIMAMAYSFLRLILLAPAIVVERIANPLTALRRAWHLSRGNFGRIALFLVLLGLVLVVAMGAVIGTLGSLAAMAIGREAADIVSAVVSSSLVAGFLVYFAGILAAIHRQLAGPFSDKAGSTFD